MGVYRRKNTWGWKRRGILPSGSWPTGILGCRKCCRSRSYLADKSQVAALKGEFGNYNIREIKPAMIEAFQHKMLSRTSDRTGKPYAPATANRMLEVIKRIYNLAMREDMVVKNPCLKVTKLPENNRRDRVITHAEYESIIARLPKYAADIVTTAYYTGMRAGEIFNLTWQKVKLEEGYIDLRAEDTKTSEPRRIPLNDVLGHMLAGIGKVRYLKHTQVYTYQGNPVKNIKRSFNRACRKRAFRTSASTTFGTPSTRTCERPAWIAA